MFQFPDFNSIKTVNSDFTAITLVAIYGRFNNIDDNDKTISFPHVHKSYYATFCRIVYTSNLFFTTGHNIFNSDLYSQPTSNH